MKKSNNFFAFFKSKIQLDFTAVMWYNTDIAQRNTNYKSKNKIQ